MYVVDWVMGLHSRCGSRSSCIACPREMIDFDREGEGSILQTAHTTEDELTTHGSNKKNPNDQETYKKPRALGVGEARAVSKGLPINQKDESTSDIVYGWPLLRMTAAVASYSPVDDEANQSKPTTHHPHINSVFPETENPIRKEILCSKDNNHVTSLTQATELFLKLDSHNCKRFSYEEIKQATSQFSPDNLIGEGGCGNVYRGSLPGSDGKQVAVKVLKSYKEAWNDFSLEVDITSSLNHKGITPLVGVCIEDIDDSLILVTDFLPNGSLEENLHGERSVLPWDVRFKVSVAIAEALDHLHNESPRPVIHRDVKSSNILLSAEFHPQITDFGLAIWGPADSGYVIHEDVVGTFGYIAPEYFMHGKVSDKIDVYSFGVVLLELLSGRKPIGSSFLKGQQGLVKWAQPILKNGNAETLLDPKLNGDYDVAQMQRMILAANLCVSQSPRFRPNIREILELLRGESDAKEWFHNHLCVRKGSANQDDDGDFQDFSDGPHLDFSVLNVDFDARSLSSSSDTPFVGTEQNHPASLAGAQGKQQHRKLKDYLKEELD